MEAPDAPPLKKFRALFEETDPDRVKAKPYGANGSAGAIPYSGDVEIESQTPDLGLEMSQSQFGPTQPQKRVRRSEDDGSTAQSLPMVIEEDDEMPATLQSLGSSGEATTDDGDVEMANVEDEAPARVGTQTQRKQIAFSSKSKAASAPRSKSVQPATTEGAPREPDTDTAFLKALSQRRSKTSKAKGGEVNDAFDRDFNNLRIVKPDLDGERERVLEKEREEWKMLAEFGDDTGVRGNFMVVVEIDVPERAASARECSVGRSSGKLVGEGKAWQGKPDFKKFKKVS